MPKIATLSAAALMITALALTSLTTAGPAEAASQPKISQKQMLEKFDRTADKLISTNDLRAQTPEGKLIAMTLLPSVQAMKTSIGPSDISNVAKRKITTVIGTAQLKPTYSPKRYDCVRTNLRSYLEREAKNTETVNNMYASLTLADYVTPKIKGVFDPVGWYTKAAQKLKQPIKKIGVASQVNATLANVAQCLTN